MKKITVLALHLGYGGIEKCIANLVNSLVELYEIEIVSTYKLLDKPAFEIDKRVEIKYLIEDLKPNKNEIKQCIKKLKFINLIKEIKRSKKILRLKKDLMIDYIKKCNSDIIISTRDIHNLWLGEYGKKDTIKIGWEHNHHNDNKKYIKKIINSVLKLDYFVLVSNDLTQFYKDKTGNCKCIFIPNSITYIPPYQSKLEEKNIVSIGRLSKEKGFLDLIDVFNLVHEIYPDWKLNIIGDGNEREEIISKIKKYKLEETVIMHGFQNSRYLEKELLNSSIYIMTSYTESFGLVLIEASSFGIPCIAFDSAKGAKEIIKDNWDGYLIQRRDKKQMAKRIINLIKDKNRRIIMGNNAYKKSSKYLANNIKNEWIKIFEEK